MALPWQIDGTVGVRHEVGARQETLAAGARGEIFRLRDVSLIAGERQAE